tara:strand:- start:1671 stop:2672 length:1002 start_codon:yes stop_codon:yes gene_type:complete
MNYSFFGTCYEDYHLLIDCLKSMANQTLPANEIILIDSSKKGEILKYINKLFENSSTVIKYENINLPRVKALNLAISKANSDYLLRFDSRTRFSENYAETSIKILKKTNKYKIILGNIGGKQNAIPANNSLNAKLAADLFNRAYVFGNPLYRRENYSGKVNSIYLGCYPKEIIKQTLFREDINLISEDSQICQDIIAKGYEIHISKFLSIKYLCRENFYLVIKLLRSYGRCRARTIISTRVIHDNKKYLLILFMVVISPILLFYFFKNILLALILVFLIPLSYNVFHEYRNYGLKKIYYLPLLALCLQLSWILGLFETLILYKFTRNKNSNFL